MAGKANEPVEALMLWAYEGIECYVSETPLPYHIPLYRAWNGSDHLYTIDKAEYESLPAARYEKEGTACYVASTQLAGSVPLFRMYNSALDDHCYCATVQRRASHASEGYSDQGISGYVMPGRCAEHVPFLRTCSTRTGDHFYTTNVNEVDEKGPSFTHGQLRSFLLRELHDYGLAADNLHCLNGNYFCPTKTAAREIVGKSLAAQRRYIAELRDCDDFAHLLKAAFIEDAYDCGVPSMPYALGIIWGARPRSHAMNVLVEHDGKKYSVQLIEPQNGTFSGPSKRVMYQIALLVM